MFLYHVAYHLCSLQCYWNNRVSVVPWIVRIDPFRFVAECRASQPDLGLVFIVYFVLYM